MQRFEVGDIVRISKQSEYYSFAVPTNPKDTDGKVIRADLGHDDGYEIRVKWDTGRENSYRIADLKLRRKG